MSTCLVTKLKDVVNNSTLPLLEYKILKTSINTKPDINQFVYLEDFTNKNLLLRELKIEAKLKIIDNKKSTTLLSSHWGYLMISINELNELLVKLNDAAYKKLCNNGEEYIVTIDGSNASVNVNGTEFISVNEPYNSMCKWNLFAKINNDAVPTLSNTSNFNKGSIELNYLKFYHLNNLVCDLVPAEINGIPCLYDKIEKIQYYANDGDLIVY